MKGNNISNVLHLKYAPLHPFDTVYTLVFILLILDLMATTILQDIINWTSLEKSFYSIVVSIFLFFQLLRMYYHLKNFESIISTTGNKHFLEILPPKTQIIEKLIRLFLALILVLFSKIQAEYNASPPLTLLVCFISLFIWDIFILHGMKSILSDEQKFKEIVSTPKAEIPALTNFRKFYYIEKDDLKPSFSIRESYIKNLKFPERVLGVFASLIAATYYILPKLFPETQIWGILIFFLGASAFAIFVIALFGKIKTKEIRSDNIHNLFSDSIKNIFAPLFMPILTLINNLKSVNDKRVEKIWQWIITTFVVVIFGLMVLFHYSHDNQTKPIEDKQIETTNKQ